MNDMRTKFGLRWWCVCGVALGVAATCAWGGLTPPLYVGNVAPVLDQYGRPMFGSNDETAALDRSRVEIRLATDGIIRPPTTNGVAHAKNPLLTPESICGMGENASIPGFFAMVLSERPASGTKVFARVFNAPTAAEASFYADSQITTGPASDSSLVLTFGVAQPLDAGDADEDGLNNSWEQALGTDDRSTPDYDGDGMSDLNEMLAGTDATSASSLLAFRLIQRETAAQAPAGAGTEWTKPVRVRWQSVPGKKYRLEYLPQLVGNDPETGKPYAFDLVGSEVTAEDDEFEIDMLVDVPADVATGTFRVKLVQE